MTPHPDFDPTDEHRLADLPAGPRPLGPGAPAADVASGGPGVPDLEVVRREIVLDADPGAVWAELASGAALRGWLADEVDLHDVRPGATGTVRDGDGPLRPVRVDEVVDGRRLGLTWRDEDGRETVVELTLAPDGEDGGGRLAEGEEGVGAAGDPGAAAAGRRPGRGAPRTRLVVVEVPVATLRLVAPAAARALRPAPPAHGSGPVARALAGVR